MMTCCSEVRELGYKDFDVLAKPLFDALRAELRDEKWKTEFNWNYFSAEWKKWMMGGIARTWYTDGAILGGVFTEDLFSGAGRALVMFWAADPTVRGTGRAVHLLEAFEEAARKIGADCAAAVHTAISPDHLASLYVHRGYKPREYIFVKGNQ